METIFMRLSLRTLRLNSSQQSESLNTQLPERKKISTFRKNMKTVDQLLVNKVDIERWISSSISLANEHSELVHHAYLTRNYNAKALERKTSNLRMKAEELAKLYIESNNPETRTQAYDLVKSYNSNSKYQNQDGVVQLCPIRMRDIFLTQLVHNHSQVFRRLPDDIWNKIQANIFLPKVSAKLTDPNFKSLTNSQKRMAITQLFIK